MRLTVGPLPPAVYWRRRAVVIGAALLFLIVLVYSCSGPGNSGASPEDKTSPTPTSGAEPGESVLTPETGGPPTGGAEPPGDEPDPGAGGPGQQAAPDGGGSVPQVVPPAAGSCTDDDMSVVAVPAYPSVQRGVTIELSLKIKNISDRVCSRDAGSQLQEIYIRLGAQVIWSSDTCSGPGGSNVLSLQPNIEHEFRVAWNGQDSTRCTGGVASGPEPEPGDYQLFGRLGTKHSKPVKLTITA